MAFLNRGHSLFAVVCLASSLSVQAQAPFSFGSVKAWFQDLNSRVQTQPPSQTPSVQKVQLETVYDLLKRLQAARVAYVQNLDTLIAARESHAKKAVISADLENFRLSAVVVNSLLKQFETALQPLQLGLDMHHPEISMPAGRYDQVQDVKLYKSLHPEIIFNMTDSELHKLRGDINANGIPLQEAINATLAMIRNKYPTVGEM